MLDKQAADFLRDPVFTIQPISGYVLYAQRFSKSFLDIRHGFTFDGSRNALGDNVETGHRAGFGDAQDRDDYTLLEHHFAIHDMVVGLRNHPGLDIDIFEVDSVAKVDVPTRLNHDGLIFGHQNVVGGDTHLHG